ncbi:MAG TPA: ribosomal protein S18-alanine N-acetyltransferase [Allosphingosinicella sp.]
MSDRTVTIGDGGLQDIDNVMSVMSDSFDPCYGEAWTAPQCAGLLPMPGVWLTLARAGDEVVGFAMARAVVREAELLLLAVKRKDRNAGVGKLLLDAFMERATDRGAERLHLEVREGNHAVTLYRRAGFTEVGRRRNYYSGRDGQIYDALTLARSVSN